MVMAAKQFDIIVACDIHLYTAPAAGPLPTPTLGYVFDPLDAIIGRICSATDAESMGMVLVNGLPAAGAGTSGLVGHIPIGTPNPVDKRHWLDQILMGSRTVLVRDNPFSRLGSLTLDCACFGLPPPTRKRWTRDPSLLMMLPTGLTVSVSNVLVGGPPAVLQALTTLITSNIVKLNKLRAKYNPAHRAPKTGWFSLLVSKGKHFIEKNPMIVPVAMHLLKRGLSGASDIFGFDPVKVAKDVVGVDDGDSKSGVKDTVENVLDYATTEGLFGTLYDTVGDPVSTRDGSVILNQSDFEIPGRVPLVWQRHYWSKYLHDGHCGYGWRTPADICLEFRPGGPIFFHAPDTATCTVFFDFPDRHGEENAVPGMQGKTWLFHQNDELIVKTEDGLRYCFSIEQARTDHVPGRSVMLSIQRIENGKGWGWRFEWKEKALVRIVETGDAEAQGRFIEVSSRAGQIHRLQLYDPATGKNYLLTDYHYDADNDLVKVSDEYNGTYSFEYSAHRMIKHTNRAGLSFYYVYDIHDRAIRTWGDHGLYDYTLCYHELLNETEVADADGRIVRVRLGEHKLPLCEIDANDGVTFYQYDDFLRATTIIDPEGLKTLFEYDANGHCSKVIRPDGCEVIRQYDAQGRLTVAIDENENGWVWIYDGQDSPMAAIDPNGGIWGYTYNESGQLIEQKHPDGRMTSIEYDRYGLISAVVACSGMCTEYRHDALGRLTHRRNATEAWTDYEYDEYRRLARIVHPDARSTLLEYDAQGRLLRYSDPDQNEMQWRYTETGKLGGYQRSDGTWVAYQYDGYENLSGIELSSGLYWQIHRDAMRHIERIEDSDGNQRFYTFSAGGRLRAVADSLGYEIRYEVDDVGHVVRKTVAASVDYPPVMESFAYDKTGRLIRWNSPVRNIQWSYDAMGRVVDEYHDEFEVRHAYDAVGRRIERRTSAGNRISWQCDSQTHETVIYANESRVAAVDSFAESGDGCPVLGIASDASSDGFAPLSAMDEVIRLDYFRRFWTMRSFGERYSGDKIGRLLQDVDPLISIKRYVHACEAGFAAFRIQEMHVGQAVSCSNLDGLTDDASNELFGQWSNVIGRADQNRMDSGEVGDDSWVIRWEPYQRLLEVRRNEQTIEFGYDARGRMVYRRDDQNTAWFFWDERKLLGEVKCANDMPDAPETKTYETQSLSAVRRRQYRLGWLTKDLIEYVSVGAKPVSIDAVLRSAV